MKQSKRLYVSLILVLSFIVAVLGYSKNIEAASSAPYIDTTNTVYFKSADEIRQFNVYVYNPTSSGKISALKCSNEDILTVKNNKSYVTVTPKAFGSATITFKYAKKTLKQKIIIQKWVNPCKSIKIGSTEYVGHFDDYNWYNTGQTKNTKGKINVVPTTGWKLVGINNNYKKIKNKGSVSLDLVGPDGTGSNVVIYLKNTKTKEEAALALGCIKNGRAGGYFSSKERIISGFKK